MSHVFKRSAKWLVDRTLLPLVRYLVKEARACEKRPPVQSVHVENLGPLMQGHPEHRFPRMISRVTEPELEAAAALIRERLDRVMLFTTVQEIRRFCVDQLPKDVSLRRGPRADGERVW